MRAGYFANTAPLGAKLLSAKKKGKGIKGNK
jgi:hypothetical protein